MTCKRLFAEIHNKRQLQLKVTPKKGISGVTLLDNSDVVMVYSLVSISRNLPPTLTHLELGPKFRLMDHSFMPPSLTSLKLKSVLHYNLRFDQLPPSLKTLELGDHFKNYSENTNRRMPATITSLSLGNVYNDGLPSGLLPSSLKSLTLGARFDQRIGERSLPLTLETLRFGRSYTQEFGLGVLPPSLTSLSFHEYSLYEKEFIPGVLPNQLQSLTLGKEYNQIFRVGSLPPALTHLSFLSSIESKYNQEFQLGVLPASLQTLTLGHTFKQSIRRGILPNSLTNIDLPMNGDQVIEPGALPNSLISLTLSVNPVISVGMLPNSLQSLYITSRFADVIPMGALPESLTKLSFEGCLYLDHPITPGTLPSSLKTLTIIYIHPIIQGTLPSALTSLKLINFNRIIQPGVLPSSITALDLGHLYAHSLTAKVLPSSLTSLRIGGSPLTFPRLETLEISSLKHFTEIKCDYIGSLVINSGIDSRKSNGTTPWPSTKQHFGSFTIGSRSHSSTTDPKYRVQHIKSLIRSIPNADSYNIHSQEWSVQLRKTDPWNTIILISTYKCKEDEQSIANKKRIQFVTLDKSGELVSRLEDEINRLKKENDRLTITNAELVKSRTKTDDVNNRLKQENDQLKCKVERLVQEKKEESKKLESVSNQLNQYLKE
ncbi:hypothetical protein SAMD00019534_068850 [Acytostelium subglobosum LB1]|uniref:hypothetical protein n=1 Tax=Acytostelium subglobosum LB1 TaxID=1410327 RepID=UPI000644DC6D|nr:hypothetical protein SAMD00019534_068850 [Acytostelium subglobosum LB1]GAM23710.1 hypothetical protein SAMD00019534_068850 [Acytostelium subglobosum LB1]|eukprot:XP_012753451.1 hypothetical protein SAMD00019534_068850 [Acytostelium subglobosum LB1]